MIGKWAREMSAKKGSKKTTFVTDGQHQQQQQQQQSQSQSQSQQHDAQREGATSGGSNSNDDEATTNTNAVDETTPNANIADTAAASASNQHPGAADGTNKPTVNSVGSSDDDNDDEDEDNEDATTYENPFTQRYSISNVSNKESKPFSKTGSIKGDMLVEMSSIGAGGNGTNAEEGGERVFSAVAPTFLHQDDIQVEVSSTPAFQSLEELFQAGKLTGTQVAQLKARYTELLLTLNKY